MTRSGVRGVRAAFLLAALTVAMPAAAGQPPPGRGVLLDLPYLTQTEQLCGGAALAMVLRYWGDTTVVPEDFASLVDRSAGGIRTSVLTEAVTRRGWSATPFAADPETALEWL